jgi:hypothetical protein
MKASRDEPRAEPGENASAVREAAPEYRAGAEGEIDVSLLEDSLARTPWKRMQANDDALRFADLGDTVNSSSNYAPPPRSRVWAEWRLDKAQ